MKTIVRCFSRKMIFINYLLQSLPFFIWSECVRNELSNILFVTFAQNFELFVVIFCKLGYVRFMYVRREELRKESPDMHHLDVTKKIGEEWMAMSDEKKEPYLEAAKEDKIR